MGLRFAKYHGIGNDFVMLDGLALDETPPLGALAKRLCDRHTGIGADGLILAERGRNAAFRMRMFNPDGSESEMCGNGLRCMAAFLLDEGHAEPGEWAVETGAGVLMVRAQPAGDTTYTVDMGLPSLEARAIGIAPFDASTMVDAPTPLGYRGTAVSMGNPHLVILVEDVATVPLTEHGPALETWDRFPHRTNVHFVQVLAPDHLKVRTWERGAGATLACGTGACACLVAAHANGRSGKEATLSLPGGDLRIALLDDGHVSMSGPAVRTFSGTWA